MGRYLIVNGDDFGMCHSANLAILDLFKNGRITSTTIITVAPWAKEAIKMIKEQPELLRAGVHITHTSEWDTYRWHGFLDIKELQDEDRMFPKAPADALKVDINLRIDEAKEQIKWALNQGIEITHLDNHMRTCMDHEEELLKICYDNDWGYRFHEEKGYSDKAIEFLKDHDVPVPDYINYNDGQIVSDNKTYESHAAMYKHMLHVMPEGITEWFTHPALETDELKAIAPDYRIRINDYRFLMSDEFIQTLKDENITLIGYEDIKRIRG